MKYQYDFNVAGISFRWTTEFALELEERYRAFLQVGSQQPEVVYHVIIGEPVRDVKKETVLYDGKGFRVTEDSGYRYRTFFYSRVHPKRVVTLVQKRGCENRYRLYLPEGVWRDFQRTKTWSFYMAFEEMFYTRGRIMLHAAYVETKEGAVLFTGPSGIGKSTQAELWEQYGDGIIMNGDRTVLYERDGKVYAAGSPYAGSSAVYRNYESPVRAIIVLGKGEDNQTQRLKGSAALLPLMRESTFVYMDGNMKRRQAELLCSAAEKLPVYRYLCRKDVSAVERLKEVLRRENIEDRKDE